MGKVLHLCLGCFYIDNYSYQENLLPKYHKVLGYDVKIIASTLSFDEHGNACNVEPAKYINENGIPVVRLPYHHCLSIRFGKFLRLYDHVYEEIDSFSPDIIFVHGCQFLSISSVVKYIKEHNVNVFVDNHADFSNSARNWFSRYVQHRIMWRSCAQRILPYTAKFYGVLPARVDFLVNEYKLPSDKVELLVMGVDDQLAKEVTSKEIVSRTRSKYNINEEDFLIVTGGKIDMAKKEIVDFSKGFMQLKSSRNLRLIVFGSVIPELEQSLLDACDGHILQYIGWLNNQQVSEVLAASNLAVFPGRHSVLWEQAVGLGIPMVVKEWAGTTHVDCGGNVRFIDGDSPQAIIDAVSYSLNDENYAKMIDVANSCKKSFSYLQIAKKSIGII